MPYIHNICILYKYIIYVYQSIYNGQWQKCYGSTFMRYGYIIIVMLLIFFCRRKKHLLKSVDQVHSQQSTNNNSFQRQEAPPTIHADEFIGLTSNPSYDITEGCTKRDDCTIVVPEKVGIYKY